MTSGSARCPAVRDAEAKSLWLGPPDDALAARAGATSLARDDAVAARRSAPERDMVTPLPTWAAEHADYGAEGPEKVNRHKWAAKAHDTFKMYDYEAPEPEKTGFRRAPAEKSGRRWLP